MDAVVLHVDDQNQADWWDEIVAEVSPRLRQGVPRIGFIASNTQFATEMAGVIGDAAHGNDSQHAPNAAVAIGMLGLPLQATYDGYADAEAGLNS